MIFLSARDQNIIRLRYGERKTIREIAKEINLSPSYVRKLLKSSLSRMMCSFDETGLESILSILGDESNIFSITLHLNSLDLCDSLVIKLRYGLLGGQSLREESVASILGLSVEEIEERETRGLKYLLSRCSSFTSQNA